MIVVFGLDRVDRRRHVIERRLYSNWERNNRRALYTTWNHDSMGTLYTDDSTTGADSASFRGGATTAVATGCTGNADTDARGAPKLRRGDS